MAIEVIPVESQSDLDDIFRIREVVFVEEQEVDPDEEYDEFETSARHFKALVDGVPAGTARWRFTDKGIKLERFAVLKEFRGIGVGQALVEAVLADIQQHPDSNGNTCYLHAQVSAMGLYEKFGFQKEGDLFMECNISHYKMKLLIPARV
nr:GNAT family N-acetyltransferase [Lunatibacter salilacus]